MALGPAPEFDAAAMDPRNGSSGMARSRTCSQPSGPTSWEPIGITQATLPLHLVRSGLCSHSLPLPTSRFARLPHMQRLAPWMLALALFLGAWETVTAKLGLLPMPFFPPPQALLEVMIDDRVRLAEGVLASLRLLAGGYFLGAVIGFAVGVAMGWSRAVGYWIHPVLRLVGPLPSDSLAAACVLRFPFEP